MSKGRGRGLGREEGDLTKAIAAACLDMGIWTSHQMAERVKERDLKRVQMTIRNMVVRGKLKNPTTGRYCHMAVEAKIRTARVVIKRTPVADELERRKRELGIWVEMEKAA